MGDVGIAIRQLIERLPKESERQVPVVRPKAIVVEETPSSRNVLHEHVRISRPDGFYNSASGGLGFGAAASVGLSLALPERPVACLIGDGSLMYAAQALWSAACYDANVVYVVINNRQYRVLKLISDREGLGGQVPGADLPELDIEGMAKSLGCQAVTVEHREELGNALERAFAERGRAS